MTMTDLDDLRAWRGQTVVGSDGSKIGKVADIYLDDQTGQPEWIAVSTGPFGGRVSFIPLAGRPHGTGRSRSPSPRTR